MRGGEEEREGMEGCEGGGGGGGGGERRGEERRGNNSLFKVCL